MDKKRVFAAIIFVILVGIIGFFLYRLFFAQPAPQTPPTLTEGTIDITDFPQSDERVFDETQDPTSSDLPFSDTRDDLTSRTPSVGEEPARIRQVVDTRIISPAVDNRGNVRFYNQQDGKFYTVGPNDTVSALSSEIFFNAEKITWSPTTDESIIEYPDQSKIYYNFDTGKQVTLPKHWEEFSFSTQGDKIAAKSVGLSPDNRWLITSDPDGRNTKRVEALGENGNKVTVDWSPNNQVVALSRTGAPLGAERQEVLLVGQHGENFRSLVVEGRDFRSKWSADGKQLVYSVFNSRNGFRPELWVVNAEGDNIGTGRRTLGVNTWADKCTFQDERFVFCAVPSSLESGSGFQPSLADTTADNIFRIDLQTGLRSLIDFEGSHIVDTIFMGEDNDTLYFTDKIGGDLLRIDI
ncbi:MAG: hypothetical protein HN726_04015 [Candidatus Magasanikbacteria bacterium]|jgi:hypothetical protein|nr:hypothetical protein [Candidatus Magasanikbacteria bacterium]MBT4221512.1 hypothetical protein [Candidatus Magasanikbacteria bacterium]MBT4350463.1 hypothetical protein [Candidatus Magasanikbacteria bacterium]MBT4541850.1 hypothetical protein [Candidatus Magasanikbacteria bacterium]MBT6253379.1 hypothetical protein [Candidatus Magasanikbacteria bacterium]